MEFFISLVVLAGFVRSPIAIFWIYAIYLIYCILMNEKPFWVKKNGNREQ